MQKETNKHKLYNAKRGQVLKVEELKDDDEAHQFWDKFKEDLSAKSGSTKQGLKDLYSFGIDKGFFDK